MTKLEHALALAARGFKVFPIAEGAKAPPLLVGWPERATSDAQQIREWWDGVEHNIGIHCEGLVVIDVDVKKGGAESLRRLIDLLDLPGTLTHRTPSGGLHVIYALPDGHPGVPNSVEALGEGLDIRSTSGYIVAPGSTTEAGEYTVLDNFRVDYAPDWLVQKLGTAAPSKRHEIVDVEDAPEEAVERARQWLQTAERSVKGAGGDQSAYRVACSLRDMGLSYAQACEEMRGEAWDWGCGWREGWLEEKPIRSAYKYAQNEPGVKLVTASQFTASPAEDKPLVSPKRDKAKVQKADDLSDEPLAYDYLVKNWLERSTYALLFGESGQGKTFLALDFAFHVATGREWRGNKVKQGLALYLAFEGKGGIKRRLRALRKRYGASLGDLWVASASMNLREQAGRQELGALLADLPAKPALIVIDTFARAMMGGDENSAQDTGAFNNAVEALIEATGACVLVIHHSGKNKAAGARGSSAIKAALDTELEVDGGQVLSHKQRDSENPMPIGFKLVPLQIGLDADNQPLTSCTVEERAIGAAGSKEPKGMARDAWKILQEMTGESNTPVLRMDWIRKMMDNGFSKSTACRWARDLADEYNKVTIEGDYCSRRMT